MSQLLRRLLVLTVAAACSHPQPKAPPPEPNATAAPGPGAPATAKPSPDSWPAIDAAGKAITADVLRDQIAKISSDEFEGRGPMTRSDQAVRAYLAEQLKAMG